MMDRIAPYWFDRSNVAALIGLMVAMLVAAIAMVPVEWLIATSILTVLTMPAFLVVEPAVQRLRKNLDLPAS